MKNKKLEQWLLQIFATKIGWLGVSIFFVILFGVLANWYEWAEIAMMISWIYPIVLGLIMIVYGWIINPIKALIETNKKNKKDKK